MKRRSALRKTAVGAAALSVLGHVPVKGLSLGSIRKTSGRKIYLFSKHLHWVGYDEMAEIASDVGFDGLDLTVRPKGHVEPAHVERDMPKAVEAADKKGLAVEMITTAIQSADDPLTDRVLKTASELGVRYYRLGWFNYDYSISIPENIKRFGTALKKIGELNARYNLIGDYQNHAGTSGGSPVWDIYQMLMEAGSSSLGVQYDIRHAMVEGMNSWPLGLRLVAPYVHTLDIKDFEWSKTKDGWVVNNVPLGQGAVDFSAYFSLLKELNIQAPVSIHLEYPLGGAEHGLFEITIPRSQIIEAMTKDLNYLRSVM